LRQLAAKGAVRHFEDFEAVRPKMSARPALEGESEAIGLAMLDRKTADRKLSGINERLPMSPGR
jgi:hypothetical protein